VEIEDEEDDENEESARLSFRERLFLASYAQIQEYRMASLASHQLHLRQTPTHPNNFVESLLTIFVSDKVDSGEHFVFKLEKLNKTLFENYL
jgi:hypothetical protein